MARTYYLFVISFCLCLSCRNVSNDLTMLSTNNKGNVTKGTPIVLLGKVIGNVNHMTIKSVNEVIIHAKWKKGVQFKQPMLFQIVMGSNEQISTYIELFPQRIEGITFFEMAPITFIGPTGFPGDTLWARRIQPNNIKIDSSWYLWRSEIGSSFDNWPITIKEDL